MRYVAIGMFFVLVSAGCIPTSQEAPEQIIGDSGVVFAGDLEERLVGELISILKEPERHRNNNRPYDICDELAAMSPTALSPIVELLGASDTSPETQIFVLQSININMTEAYLPFIEPLLVSENGATRSCATTLLGRIETEAVVALLTDLKGDANERVAFSAWSGLAQQGVEPYRQEFVAYYVNPEASATQRSEIVRVIVTRTLPEDIPTLSLAVRDQATNSRVRRMISIILGSMGTPESIEALEKSMELDSGSDYRNLAESAIALITERNDA